MFLIDEPEVTECAVQQSHAEAECKPDRLAYNQSKRTSNGVAEQAPVRLADSADRQAERRAKLVAKLAMQRYGPRIQVARRCVVWFGYFRPKLQNRGHYIEQWQPQH